MNPTLNMMTVDLEDWFCACNSVGIIQYLDWDKCELRVGKSTKKLLDLFDKNNVKATFFVLGWIADRVPELIAEVKECGHEIASHGYSHIPITKMTPDAFADDIDRAIEVTERYSGTKIIGFRAPSFSITKQTLWATDIIKERGLAYDSSIFPIGLHPDYGIPQITMAVHKLDNNLTEVPLSCIEIFGQRIPCCGGGYFRFYPYWITRTMIRKCNLQGRPVVFYIHPWEFDIGQPRIALPRMKKFRHYNNIDKTFGRLEQLVKDFSFSSIRKVISI